MNTENLRDTITPKSDQLNADTLLAGPITVTITAVKRGSAEQPIDIHVTGQQPYKPCKSMRRVLISAWGDNGSDWVGKTMTLYCDPSVKFGGVAVGGIRISHLSDIVSDLQLSLTATRGKRTPYRVRKLEKITPAEYPDAQFSADLPKMLAAIHSGKSTIEKIIAHCEKTGTLSADQKTLLAVPASITTEQEKY